MPAGRSALSLPSAGTDARQAYSRTAFVGGLAPVLGPSKHMSTRVGGTAVIREDRELLAELASLNSDMASLALRVIECSASAAEQQHYAQQLIAAGQRLQRRANGMTVVVIEGDVEAENPIALPTNTVELDWDQ